MNILELLFKDVIAYKNVVYFELSNGKTIYVNTSFFEPSGVAVPDFDKAKVVDGGLAVQFGPNYEVAARTVLCTFVPEYRSAARANLEPEYVEAFDKAYGK